MRSRTLILALAAILVAGAACTPKGASTAAKPVPDIHTSENSLDWAGTYKGIVPCADCEGIETALTLRGDLTYTLATKYLGKSNEVVERKGTFTWNEAGNAITLAGVPDGPSQYQVGENQLTQLDLGGKRITGDLAPMYVLAKAPATPVDAPEALFAPAGWRLTELMGKPVDPQGDRKKDASLTFVREGSQVQGFNGCNSFTGPVEFLPGNRIQVKNLAATMRACIEPTVEAEFMTVLQTCDNYAVSDKALSLHKARMAPLARFEPAPREGK